MPDQSPGKKQNLHGVSSAWQPARSRLRNTLLRFRARTSTVVTAISSNMPLNALQRRESWPPTQVRLTEDHEDIDDEDLDSNPFSFFLTRPEDVKDDEVEDIVMSAGIEGSVAASGIPKPIIRTIEPSAEQFKRLEESAVYDDDDEDYIRDLRSKLAVPISLQDYMLASEQRRFNHPGRRRDRDNDRRTELSLSRGRGILKAPYGRSRGRTRSWSGARRPHAWREPSPDVWSIPEEDETEGNEAREATPALTDDGVERETENMPLTPLTPSGKVKKRVHWAD